MNQLQLGVNFIHVVDEEGCLEVFHPTLREGGVCTTFWAREGLSGAFPLGKAKDALLAVVVTAREHLGLSVVLTTNGTGDLLLQILQSFLHFLAASHLPRSKFYNFGCG